MRDFGVPGPLAPALGLLLPLAELGTGLALLPVAIPDSHCFGQLHSAPIESRMVIRNLVLPASAK